MKAEGQTINMSDLEQDSMVMFQHKHYIPCFLLAGFILPTLLPHLLWGEHLFTAYFMAVVRYTTPQPQSPLIPLNSRYVFVLHATWLVNSAAHFFGNKPYDSGIGPCENRYGTLTTVCTHY